VREVHDTCSSCSTLLYGVPTNAQLTLTLLRLGEAHKAPLPPPPFTGRLPPPEAPPARHITGDLAVDAEHNEVLDNSIAQDPTGSPSTSPDRPKKKHGKKLLGFVKGVTRAGVTTILGIDQIKAVAGSENALQKRGVLPRAGAPRPADGPSGFTARCHGKKGTAYVITTAASPCLSFEQAKGGVPVFSIALDDITQIRKIGGLGWKTKLIVGFALGMEIQDGIVLTDRQGVSYTLTAVPRRDELFNRLISSGFLVLCLVGR
jgi:hypothetical protein